MLIWPVSIQSHSGTVTVIRSADKTRFVRRIAGFRPACAPRFEATGYLDDEDDESRRYGGRFLQALCQTRGEAFQRRRTVQWGQSHIQQAIAVRKIPRFIQRTVQFSFGFDNPPPSCAQQVWQAAITPGPDIIVRT